MDINILKNLLKKYNLKPNFTYGQNFLIDDLVLEKIINAAGISPNDQILEIGAGVGNLTRRLCQQAGFVLSIEKDPKFLPILKAIKKDFPNNFRFEIADVLEYNFQKTLIARGSETATADVHADQRAVPRNGSASSSASYKVVANIPYYITGKILEMFVAAKFKPESVTLLIQKEVAQRIVAKAGDLSVLAISVQIYGKPEILGQVPAESFYPVPEVDSAILKIDLYNQPKFAIADEKKFFKVVKACFAGKRKQIHNTLVNNLHLEKELVGQILSELKIDSKTRPQELTIEEWVSLAKKLF